MITIGVLSDTHLLEPDKWCPKTRDSLPASKIVTAGNFRLALVHGGGYLYNIEDKLFDIFAPIDCIVYGHTHKAVCRRYGPTLMVNPGSFTSTGTYAIIKVDRHSMEGRIHHIENTP
ncbi:MAG: metallophosphoesterase family protein [Desulfobulbaceae bacterium]